MGPDLPARPKFSWDLRNAPWTDGRGPQDGYYDSVLRWKAFHDKLPDTNSNKIPRELQGVVIQSQLFGRALDLSQKLSADEIGSVDGALNVAKCIHKRDALSAVSYSFQRYLDVFNTKQGDNETFLNFETRFDAQVSRFHASCSGSKLPDALIGFMLLANSKVSAAELVSILAAAAPKEALEEGANILDQVEYGKIASIFRACDKPTSDASVRGSISGNAYVQSNATSMSNGSSRRKPKKNLSPTELADLKSKSTCHVCHQKGH